MKRREFLTSTSLAGLSIFLLPVLPSFEEKHITKYVDNIKMDGGGFNYTDNFFVYMKNHAKDINYTYERVHTPSFIIDDPKSLNAVGLFVKTRKLKTAYPVSFDYDKHYNHKKGGTQVFELGEVPRHCYDNIFSNIVQELNAEYKEYQVKMFYIYALINTPLIYDPESFSPRTGFMIRYCRI